MASKIKIMLDPGHNENSNVSPADKSYIEGVQMFKLSNYLKTELIAKGIFEVYITRAKVTDNPTVAERGTMAVTKNCDVFVSLHSDAYGNTATTPAGTSVFYSLQRPDTKTFASTLAKNISTLLNKTTGISYSRGAMTRQYSSTLKTTDYYGVIRNSVKSATVKYSFLIEHGFHTNAKECAFLKSDTNLKALAKVMADTFYEEFKDKVDKPSSPTISTTNGSFVVKSPINVYASAANAMAKTSAKTKYPAGAYHVYKVYGSVINISKTKGTPGGWINPAENVTKLPVKGDLYNVIKTINGYATAANAKNRTDKKSSVKAGTYYIYTTNSGMYNVSSNPNTPGSWINPADNK